MMHITTCVMLISVFKTVSGLIYKLLANGYPDHDVATLLQHLDIFESDDDLCKLLIRSDNGLTIERCIVISDELCASSTITDILVNNIMLNGILNHDIINYDGYLLVMRGISAIDLYNNGYRIIIGEFDFHDMSDRNLRICETTSDLSRIHNAYNNGLYMTQYNMQYSHINPEYVQFSDMLKELTGITFTFGQSDATRTFNVISLCKNITYLHITHMTKAGDIDKYTCAVIMGNLKELCRPFYYTDDTVLDLCKSLEKLNASSNCKITTCEPFSKTLKSLCASNSCGISDIGISLCSKLKELYASCNTNITTCKPFAKTLKILGAMGESCGIADDGLSSCTRLKKLYVQGNYKITTCKPFANTLKILDFASYIRDDQIAKCKKLKILNNYRH